MNISIKMVMAAALSLGAFAGTPGALDWPSAQAQTVSNFGGNNKGRAQLGDTFTASGPLTAVGEGELIFAAPEESAASRLPSTLGAWIALDHGDGMVGVYARVDDFDLDLVPQKIEQGTVIANCGSSGWSEKEGFYLSFYDRKERRWVNPSLVLPHSEDKRAPAIHSVKLSGGGAMIDLAAPLL
jgi:septal ring factor EnvC (AmiA/AmiB activator)